MRARERQAEIDEARVTGVPAPFPSPQEAGAHARRLLPPHAEDRLIRICVDPPLYLDFHGDPWTKTKKDGWEAL